MANLSTRALLVNLSISQWTARKLDRNETAAITRKHGCADNVARVNKSLLPMAHSLDVIHKMTGAIRTDYYKHSLPWSGEGVQIIKAEGYLGFVQMIGDHKVKWEAAVSRFIADYPQLQEDAKYLLNGMYRDEDYPDVSEIARKFRMDVNFMPVPDACDWRVSLGDDELDQLRNQIEAQVLDAQGNAMRAAWQRVKDVVSKAHERLADPDNIFRDSLVENARELCAILPTLNLTGDPEMEKIRFDLEGSLCKHEAVTLRENIAVREQVTSKLDEIMAKMGGMYG